MGSEVWNLIDNPKLNNHRKLSRFKNSDDINSIDDINKIYGCFHSHVERIDQNMVAIGNGINDLFKSMYKINEFNIESVSDAPKVDHTLGVLTGYELFRLIQYSQLLNEKRIYRIEN